MTTERKCHHLPNEIELATIHGTGLSLAQQLAQLDQPAPVGASCLSQNHAD